MYSQSFTMAELAFLLVIIAHGICCSQINGSSLEAPNTPEEIDARISALTDIVKSLGKQLMEERLYVEERIRSEGMSGVKQVRQYHQGTSPYFADTHIGGSAGAIHDHSNYDRTLGMGEISAVMDGVEFRTRHNDYKLRMPSRNSSAYQATEYIEYPRVPPEVLNKETVQEQVDEMREWFRAFKEQNITIRDYRPYFKPVLCILEGTWILPTQQIEEPYQSDRHHIDASSWDDLLEKIKFTSYTGTKHNVENLAYLPRKLYDIQGDIPKIAQWNYRIICHPLSFDLPTRYFRLQEDLAHRVAHRLTLDKMRASRAARFKINEYDQERDTVYTLLDRMMYEFPGLDNYRGNLTEVTYGLESIDLDQGAPLNVANYTRWYKYSEMGAMGQMINHRGYNDENLWIATNTQPHVMPIRSHSCETGVCVNMTRRVSYALPLEVVYMTPLYRWNPYDIAFYPGDPITDPIPQAVAAGGRNGGHSAGLAYNGTNSKTFYRTPMELYRSQKVQFDYADTAQESVGVLDKQGKVQLMAASGPRIITPNIDGVGSIRLRYPVFPVHAEGSTVGKELEALKTIVNKLNQLGYLLDERPGDTSVAVAEPDVHFILSEATREPPGAHVHEFYLPAADYAQLVSGTDIKVTSSFAFGHIHDLVLHYDQSKDSFTYNTCDGKVTCWDGHPSRLIKDI